MKIAVVNTWTPFVAGGAELLAEVLTKKLQERGHQALLVRVPFQWSTPERIAESVLACKLMRLESFDLVIALRFPVYCIPHGNKVIWQLDALREACETQETHYGGGLEAPDGRKVRQYVNEAEKQGFGGARKIFAASEAAASLLKELHGIEAEVLNPPLIRAEEWQPDNARESLATIDEIWGRREVPEESGEASFQPAPRTETTWERLVECLTTLT